MIVDIKHVDKALCDHFEPSYGEWMDIEHGHELGFMSKYR